jgi:hypothetical protein
LPGQKFGLVSDRPPATVSFRDDTYEYGPNCHNQSKERFHDDADFRTGIKPVSSLRRWFLIIEVSAQNRQIRFTILIYAKKDM